MVTHELKTRPKNFQPIYEGTKNFEIRYNDRDYKVGDRLRLREYDISTGKYSGMEVLVRVDYLLDSFEDPAISLDYVVMSTYLIYRIQGREESS